MKPEKQMGAYGYGKYGYGKYGYGYGGYGYAAYDTSNAYAYYANDNDGDNEPGRANERSNGIQQPTIGQTPATNRPLTHREKWKVQLRRLVRWLDS